MEFRLFGEQYLKIHAFFVPGNFLFIKGKVQQRPKYYKSDEFQKEFRILQIDVLEEVRSKLANSLYVQWNYRPVKERACQSTRKFIQKT